MTTATANRTDLETADSADILEVLREQYHIWGSGMPRDEFRDWLRQQMRLPWGRRNLRCFVMRDKGRVVASCKLYTLSVQSRGVEYKVGGVGAVYTMQHHRGRGHATDLMESLEDLAREENYDALLLFSEIDPSFYEQLGYYLMSHHEFYIWLNEPETEKQVMSDRSFVEDLHEHEAELTSPEDESVESMVRHHMRYLPSLPWGIRRDDAYWNFKLFREQFLQQFPQTGRPGLEMLSIDMDSASGGYAIFEQDRKILRVLEVVGRADTREILWRNILRTALLRRVHLVRGWESVAPSFVKGMKYVTRDTGLPMLLPLGEAAEDWEQVLPCPLLELDHF